MKNRFLPISLITAFLGLSLLFSSMLSLAGQPGNPDLKKFHGSWWESVRANQNTGMVNPQDVANARQQADALRLNLKSGSRGLNWLSVGPDNYPGLVESAIFDNTDPSGLTIIAGSNSGGIWKSIDLGLTWTPMPVDNGLVLKVSSLTQASDGTIYAATGVTSCKTINFNGNGIYRSVGGGSFSVIPATQSNSDFRGITKLAINTQTGRIFAATMGGLYYSDNGIDWIKAISGYATDVFVGTDGTVLTGVGDSAYVAPLGDLNARVNLSTGNANALPNSDIGWMVFAIAPSDANVMYASIATVGGKLLNIYSSIDKGATWSTIFPNNATFEPFSGYGCYSNALAVFPNDPYKVYLGGRDMWYGHRVTPTGFYNWEQVSFGTFGTLSPFFAPLYHHTYMFRPNNPSQLVMASDGGVTIATNGANGITYQTSNKNLQSSQFNSVAYSAQKGFMMGGGDRIGTLVLGYFAPSQVSFANDGYQVWREDESLYGANYQPQHANYCGSGGTCVWSNVDSRIAVYTKRGVNTIRRQDFTDINYDNFVSQNIKTDTLGHVPMRLWETFNQGQVFGITRDSAKFFAEQKYIPADTTIMVRSKSNNFLFPYVTTAPIPKGDSITVADPIAGRFFIYGDSTHLQNHYSGIFMTMDLLKMSKTPEYFFIFDNVLRTDPVTAMAISADLNTLWAGTSKGRLIRVTGILNAYDSATSNIASSQCVLVDSVYANTPFVGRTVTSISIHPDNSNRVMVTLGNYGNQNYVYYSLNGSDPAPVFTSIQGNLPQVPVYSGLLEMTGNNNALLGTDLGVFTTTNLSSGTPEWVLDIQNIGDVAVTDIQQQVMRDFHIQNHGVIYLSSYGRGLWMDTTYYSPLGMEPGPGVTRTNGDLKLNPNPVQDNLNINYMNENSGNINVAVYDLSGRLLINSSLGIQPKGMVNASINLSGLSHGTYIVKVGSDYGKVVKL